MDARRQLGLVWGGVAAALVALSPLGARLAAALPPCPLRSLTGLPCPGCGTTRAALALAELDVAAAFSVSPLAAAAWSALVGGGLVAGALAVAGVGTPDLPRPGGRADLLLRFGAAAAILANWIYLVATGA